MAGLFDTQGIENFYDAAIVKDFARQNLFRVLALGGNNFTQQELLYVTSTTLPGRAITNVPVPFMGLSFNVPGTANYPNSQGWQITFRVPSDLSILRKFEDWTKYIFDDRLSTGAYNIPSKDVQGQIVLVLLDKQGTPLREYTLYGAYCQAVNDLTVNLTSAGEILEQQATIAYQFWRLTGETIVR
jgi:hypothetical protein